MHIEKQHCIAIISFLLFLDSSFLFFYVRLSLLHHLFLPQSLAESCHLIRVYFSVVNCFLWHSVQLNWGGRGRWGGPDSNYFPKTFFFFLLVASVPGCSSTDIYSCFNEILHLPLPGSSNYSSSFPKPNRVVFIIWHHKRQRSQDNSAASYSRNIWNGL